MQDQFLDYMRMRYERAAHYQTNVKQRVFDLTFGDYLGLHTLHQITTLQRHFHVGTIDGFLGSKWGYVLSWSNNEARDYGVLNVRTAKIMPRQHSQVQGRLGEGDRHTARSRAKISAKMQGRTQTREHVEKRAAAQRGVTRKPMSEEAKEKLRATRAANRAAKAAK